MTRIVTLIICCSVLTMAPEASEARRYSRTRVALIPLSASGRAATKVARKATLAIAKQMRRNRRLSLVVFNQRRAQRLRRCMQVPECVKAVSRKLRVRYMVSGQVLKLGRRYHVDMLVAARATGRVVTSGTFRVRHPWSAKTKASRLAIRLVHKARRGIRVAAASTTATDAVPASTLPRFSRSEAEQAARIIEVRDQENPLSPEAPASTETVAASTSPDIAPTPSAAPVEVMVNTEPGLVNRLASRRYMHAWGVAAAGIVTLGAGVAFGAISARSNTSAAESRFQREAWLQRDKAQKNALTANILYGVGGAAVVTSVVLFYLEHRKEIRELRNTRSNDLSLEFQVAQQGGGVTLKGSF